MHTQVKAEEHAEYGSQNLKVASHTKKCKCLRNLNLAVGFYFGLDLTITAHITGAVLPQESIM